MGFLRRGPGRQAEKAARGLEQDAQLLETIAASTTDRRTAQQLAQGAAERRAGAAELRQG